MLDSAADDIRARVMALTDGKDVETAIEAVGVPATFLLCEDIVAPGGVVANIGMHGQAVELHLKRLRSRNISITTSLVGTNSTPMLLITIGSRKIDPMRLVTHHFKLDKILAAYDTVGRASETQALKVIIAGQERNA